jgi:urease accessory protein
MLLAQAAEAHHVMGGKTPTTFVEGLLSGLGHPIIGVDHFAFLIGVGLVVAVARLRMAAAGAFIAASAIGVALHVQGIDVAGVEVAVAASVLVAGIFIAADARIPAAVWFVLFAVAGLFHGHAYGESIFGAEQSALWAYLTGLVIVQTAITAGVALAVTAWWKSPALGPRMAGAAVAGVGVATLAARLLPA